MLGSVLAAHPAGECREEFARELAERISLPGRGSSGRAHLGERASHGVNGVKRLEHLTVLDEHIGHPHSWHYAAAGRDICRLLGDDLIPVVPAVVKPTATFSTNEVMMPLAGRPPGTHKYVKVVKTGEKGSSASAASQLSGRSLFRPPPGRDDRIGGGATIRVGPAGARAGRDAEPFRRQGGATRSLLAEDRHRHILVRQRPVP